MLEAGCTEVVFVVVRMLALAVGHTFGMVVGHTLGPADHKLVVVDRKLEWRFAGQVDHKSEAVDHKPEAVGHKLERRFAGHRIRAVVEEKKAVPLKQNIAAHQVMDHP